MAKKQELGIVLGVIVLTEAGIVIADTATSTLLAVGDAVEIAGRRARRVSAEIGAVPVQRLRARQEIAGARLHRAT